MQCIKCGRDLKDSDTFCENCQEIMVRYPVKPGTVIVLPKHREPGFSRRSQTRRKPLSPQAKARKQRRRRIIGIVLVILGLLLSFAAGYLTAWYTPRENKLLPGQNYSTMDTTAPTG